MAIVDNAKAKIKFFFIKISPFVARMGTLVSTFSHNARGVPTCLTSGQHLAIEGWQCKNEIINE
jgi:hypothetical protein